MAALVQTGTVEDLVREVLLSEPAPSGVRLLNIELRNDHDGDPAVFITFSLSKKIEMSPARMEALREFRLRLIGPLQSAIGERIAYVQWKEVR